MNFKNVFKWMLKIVVSIMLIAVLCANADVEIIINKISELGVGIFVFSFISYLIVVLFSAIKWKLLLSDVSLWILIKIMFTAQFYSTILPGQLFGEASKVLYLHKENKSDEEITASVIVDKIIGLISVAFLGVIGMALTRINQLQSFRIFFLVVFIILVLMLLSPRIKILAKWILVIITKLRESKIMLLKKIAQVFSKIYETWNEYVKDINTLIIAVFLGVIVQFAGIVQEYGIGVCLGFYVPVYEFFWIYATLSLLLLLPVSFAGLGVREVSLVGLLGLFGVSKEHAITLSVIMVSSQLIGAMIGGIIIIYEQIVNVIRK